MNKKDIGKKRQLKKTYRVLLDIILIVCLAFGSALLVKKSLFIDREYTLSYSEVSSVDYSVCLKENNFYESKCLGKNMKYIASLIDNVDIILNYSFSADQLIYSKYVYSISANLIISDKADKNAIIFSKGYVLVDEKIKEIGSGVNNVVSEKFSIDYDKYNTLANQFKTTYGISSDARLEIHFYIQNIGHSLTREELKYDKDADLLINIPLSEDSINVELNYALIKEDNKISYVEDKLFGNYYYLGEAIIVAIFTLLMIARLIIYVKKASNSKSEYEKRISKLLHDYDRLIIESKTKLRIKKNGYNIINVSKFEELVDVRDNIKSPIVFYEIGDHKESWFYIKDNNDIYLYIIENTSNKNGE